MTLFIESLEHACVKAYAHVKKVKGISNWILTFALVVVFEIKCICFVVAIFDLVHDVDATLHLF